MKTKLMAIALLAGSSMFAQTSFSVGVGFGGYGAPAYPVAPAYASNIPPCPGPGYAWVDGYWSQNYGRRTWVAGSWQRRSVESRYRVAPRYDERSRGRDFDRDRDRGNRNFGSERNFRGR